MKKTRKKRAPKIDLVALSAHASGNSDRTLLGLKGRFDYFEKLRGQHVLNTPFIAMEALSALARGISQGYSETDLRGTWPKAWGDSTITVPLSLLFAINEPWLKYKEAGSTVTLGEAFGVEAAKKAGSHRMKAVLATLDREMRNALAVDLEYIAASAGGSGKSLQDVIDKVAEANGISSATVKKHYGKHKEKLHEELKAKGLLKE
jgi:hypothetical protein